MKHSKLLTLAMLLPFVSSLSSCGEIAPSPENQRKFRDEEEKITMTQVIKDGEKQGYPAPSLGKTKVFVVPVEFTDYPADEIGALYNSDVKDKKALKHFQADGITPEGTGRGAENAREDIRKVYFGESSETTWHSLKSYYHSSSYGKLDFEGLVAPWTPAFTNSMTMAPVSAKEFKDNGGSAATLAQNLLQFYSDDTMKKYKIFKNDDGSDMFKNGTEFLKYFDSNSDGCFDVLEMVYSAPYYATYVDDQGNDVAIDNEMFWAYCGGTGTEGDVRKPRLSKWAFQSYYTCVEGGTYNDDGTWRSWTCTEISNGIAKVDAHTIVHETGHALGLDDYYDYDYKRSPLKGVDMMDHNVGDHNAYSKSLLGWTNPTVVTNPTTVTINSFTDTGDCIMVPYRGYFETDNKNKNTFHTEYISIELYTPTGVNAADSERQYAGAYPLCPSEAGIKVYHVDSRLGLFDYSGNNNGKFINYSDSLVSTSQSVYVMKANSNTGTRTISHKEGSTTKYDWLIEYMPRSGSGTVSSIANNNLFKAGDTFGYEDDYKGFKFNSGKSFGYKFTIDALTATSATITFYQA